MALTGELTYKGLTISNAHLRVMDTHNRVVDTSTTAVYLTAAAYAANPDSAIYTVSGSFTPSVANGANLNIVKQTYVHLKTLADYDDLTDA